MSDNERFLTPEEASQFLAGLGLQIATSTLSKMRCVGGGPVFQSFGRFPRYTPRRLREFAQSKLSAERRSTSEGPPPRQKRGRGKATSRAAPHEPVIPRAAAPPDPSR